MLQKKIRSPCDSDGPCKFQARSFTSLTNLWLRNLEPNRESERAPNFGQNLRSPMYISPRGPSSPTFESAFSFLVGLSHLSLSLLKIASPIFPTRKGEKRRNPLATLHLGRLAFARMQEEISCLAKNRRKKASFAFTPSRNRSELGEKEEKSVRFATFLPYFWLSIALFSSRSPL